MPEFVQPPISEVARRRIAASASPAAYRTHMARTFAALDRGVDLAGAPWSSADPIRAAAEIEVLTGLRRCRPTVYQEATK